MTNQITYSKFQQQRRDALRSRAARELGSGDHEDWLIQAKMNELAKHECKLHQQKLDYRTRHHAFHVELAQNGGDQQDWEDLRASRFTPARSVCSLLIDEIGADIVSAEIDQQNPEATRVSANYFITEIQPRPALGSGVNHPCITPRRFSTSVEFASA